MNKRPKMVVNYRPKDAHNCGTCRYMGDDGSCAKVTGMVDRQHVCDLWQGG